MWQILLHPLVLSEDFKTIDRYTRRLILKAVFKKLSKSPEEYGRPLIGEYKGYWKLRTGGYRVIYKIIKEKVIVLIIKIGIRRDYKVYTELFHRLKKL